MKIAIAQLNPIVGDIEGNCTRIINAAADLAKSADLVVFPELSVLGCPPWDLLERDWMISEVFSAVESIVRATESIGECGLLFGAPVRGENASGCLFNAAVLAAKGEVLLVQGKSIVPTYDLFHQAKYFRPAASVSTVSLKGKIIGISVREDAGIDRSSDCLQDVGSRDPVAELVAKGAQVLVNIAASPYQIGVDQVRHDHLKSLFLKYRLPIVFVNQVGGNDEILFDGRSMAFSSNGDLAAVGPAFEEWTSTVDVSANSVCVPFQPLDRIQSVHDALVMGVRDYVHKCGFTKAVVGLSGGIDSSVVCCLAVEALGPANVLGVTMPSQYSSKGSVEDSRLLASRLGIEFKVVPIHSIYSAYIEALSSVIEGVQESVAAENIQARIRGNILMAISNRYGYLVLSTGNKSELAVGYCTLYGDMSGALAVLADIPKTLVYELARYINREREVIPATTLEKPPSAELRPGQVDQDTLPPYPVLDGILISYIEQGLSPSQVAERGYDSETVSWVVQAVEKNEYKRRQAAPGLRVTSSPLGIGRRVPIAARHR